MASRGRSRSYGQRSQPSNHKRFVPKTTDTFAPSPSSSEDRPGVPTRPRLTAPLRASPSASASATSEAGRVTFVNYLPQDEALASGLGGIDSGGLDAVESQAVVDVLNDELAWLLKLGPRDFWREVARNESLCESLDSYLLFRNRWYDFPHRGVNGIVAGVIVGESELSRRVFMAFYRMSSNKYPGGHASDCLSAKEHSVLLQEKKILDMPQLLNVCGIYGHDNEDLTRVLVNNAVKSQPQLAEKFTGTCHHFLRISNTMYQRCSSSIEVLAGSRDCEDQGHGHFHADLLEVMDFINDAIVTLDTFVDMYKPAAMFFCLPVEISGENEDLLRMLRKLHDSLLPSLHQGFSLVSTNRGAAENSNEGKSSDFALSLKLLSMRIVNFGWKLLETCYLSDDSLEDVPLQQAAKMFPVKIDDPVLRGDIMVQTFREVGGDTYDQQMKMQEYGAFLANIEKKFYILSRIDSLRSSGWIFIDDEQFQYISEIVMSLSSNSREKESHLPLTSLRNNIRVDEDVVIMESKISQIKDLFPDYGKGFLSACLDVYNQNPEEVIQRILDGTLHHDLLLLDTSLEQMPPTKTASKNINDKGKGILTGNESRDKGKRLLVDSPSQATVLSSVAPLEDIRTTVGPSHSFASTNGRYTRKSNNDVAVSEILDSKSAKDSVRSAVLAAENYEDEYEDEYDDSFDDLGLSIVESRTEVVENVGEGTSSLRGKSRGSDSAKKMPEWVSQKTPQFFVKDGKNYSYKVSGSIAVSNAQEAAFVNQTQKEMIHGLGRGGNVPVGVPRKFMDSGKMTDSDELPTEDSNHLAGRGRGRSSSRGRGGRRGNHHRKDQAMKKHFAGLTGY